MTPGFSRSITGMTISAAVATVLVALPAAAQTGDGAAAAPPAHTSQRHHAAHKEGVEQRIDDLHKALKITADEETNWAAVAQAMRDNDAAMHSLVAEGQETKAVRVSAVDDLRRYEKFTQAHVDGLKNLIASFETLYNAMPDSQKATADEVFQRFGHKAGHAHS
jgi:transposase